MPQFNIKPTTFTSEQVSFTPSVDITIDSIDNKYDIDVNFNINDTISAGTVLEPSEAYMCSNVETPEIIVNYTEI